MPAWPQFVGGFNTSRSPHVDAEALYNLYPSQVDSPTNAKQQVLWPTPGLRSLLTVGSQRCRGLWSEDGRTFTIVGTGVYELNLTTNTSTLLGNIADDGLPASSVSNGRGGEQRMFVGGGEVRVLNLTTNALSAPIVLPLTHAPVQCGFLDGYGLLLEAGTVRVWFSALEDFTLWDGLDFWARSGTSDNLVGLAVLRDRIFCFGTHTTTIFYDSGDPDVPFVPYPGSVTAEGLISPWAWTKLGDALYWIAQNAQGQIHAVRAAEAQPQVISTDAIEFAWHGYTSLSDVETLAYTQEGHEFVAWTFPTATSCGITWCFDQKTSQWHVRAGWDESLGFWYRWRARGVCSTGNKVIVGDYSTSDIYELTPDVYTENGSVIRRLRRAPYLSAEREWLFLDQFELAAQTGVGNSTGRGNRPLISLRLSRDAGRTWVNAGTAGIGAIGQYRNRCVWRRLGRTMSDQLVLEASTTEPVPIVLAGAWLRTQAGNGQL